MLNISFTTTPAPVLSVLILPVGQGPLLGKEAQGWDERLSGALKRAIKASPAFKGKEQTTLTILAPSEKGPQLVLLVGIGEPAKSTPLLWEQAGASISTALAEKGFDHASFLMDSFDDAGLTEEKAAAHFAHGAQLRAYRFEKYRAKKKDSPRTLEHLSVVLSNAAKAKKLFAPLECIAAGACLAKDLGHEPPNVLDPETMAKEAARLSSLGVKVTLLDEKQMKKLGMGALLGVAQGSEKPPRLAIMEWNGLPKNKKQRPVALIGKGVTFDSGGISLKPGPGMDEMKFDMCGAAAVIGTMKVLAARKAKTHVVGLVGLVENMPSGHAMRPGDIVTSASGKTIEVLNTDAEGRLVLADVLWYAQKQFDPCVLIDLATLTGAILISLAHEYAGLFSNDDSLAGSLLAAGQIVDEPLWRMPMNDTFDKMVDSTVADLRNITGSREGGSITAAQFLSRFVDKGRPWAHLDIAGTAWIPKEKSLTGKGATAFGVRLLNRFITEHYEK